MEEAKANPNLPPEDFLKVFKDRYSDYEFISSGGMGKVFVAHDNILDKMVAIKILLSTFDDDRSIMRFQREAQTTCKLKHQGIVGTLDFGLTELNYPYIIMDFIEGKSLFDIIEKEESGHLDENMAVFIGFQIADAMSHAHKKGIIHRDLKTANIIVSNYPDDPNVTIIDFGLARREEDLSEDDERLTRKGAILGTPLYMSPEQASGKPGDERSDIYSLGCIIFKMLTGSTPFEGGETLTLIQKKLSEDAPAVAEQNKRVKISKELDMVITKSLKRAPDDRYQTMGEFKEALEETQTEDVLATATHKIPKLKKLDLEKTPMLALVLVVITVVGTLLMFRYKQIQEQRLYEEEIRSQELKKKTGLAKFEVQEQYQANIDAKKEMIVASDDTRDEDLKFLKAIKFSDGTPYFQQYNRPKKYQFVGVNLSKTNINGDGLRYLAGLPIVYLDLSNTNVKPDSFFHLTKLKHLKVLILKESATDDKALSYLKNCHEISSLHMNSCKLISNKGLKYIEHLPITHLDLGKTMVTDPGMKHIAEIKNLDRIYLDKTGITDDTFSLLSPCKNIYDIKISWCKNITAKGLQTIANNWPNLKELDLGYTGLKREDLKPLRKLRNLEFLNLFNIRVNDNDIDWIAKNKKLRKIHFASTDITDKGLSKLANHHIVTISVFRSPNVSIPFLEKLVAKWRINYPKTFAVFTDKDTNIGVGGDEVIELFKESSTP